MLDDPWVRKMIKKKTKRFFSVLADSIAIFIFMMFIFYFLIMVDSSTFNMQ